MRARVEQIGMVAACLMTLSMAVGPAAATDPLGLVDAARAQDESRVRVLLERKADVDARSADGSTALLWAAHWNDVATAGLLTRARANANLANDLGMTPLSRACTNGSAALVELLLSVGANPNTRIATGETPLMTCASSGNADAVRALIARGADVNAREPSQNQDALMWASAEHHANVVRLLVEAGSNPRAHTKKGFTALHFAAREGDLESVRQLLVSGVNVNIRSQPDEPAEAAKEKESAGRTASRHRHGNSGPARSRISGDDLRGQHAAARRDRERPRAARALSAGAGRRPQSARCRLHALTLGVGCLGRRDLESGVRLHRSDEWHPESSAEGGAGQGAPRTRGESERANDSTAAGIFRVGWRVRGCARRNAFLLASGAADLEIMRLLLAAGADPTQMTDTKATPVMAASGLNRGIGESPTTEAQALATVKFLFELGATAKGATTNGENALFGAAYRGWNALLALLIDKGADVNAVSKAGVTPWLAASGYGDRLGGVLYNKEGADLLLKHGADPKLGKPCQAQNKCR